MILHQTYQPDIYYTDFIQLPEKVQIKLNNLDALQTESSYYTVYKEMAFLRIKDINIDGKNYNIGLSIGEIEFDDDYNADTDRVELTDQEIKIRAEDSFHCMQESIDFQSVYLTEI